ncbi:MAG: hypothetical protein HYU87_02230 [Chloroflexi bacterium]|nr:hypothetical protein [Chloroflexota bacterium]
MPTTEPRIRRTPPARMIVGPPEEEYLSRPSVEEPRTVIRYEVRKKGGR